MSNSSLIKDPKFDIFLPGSDIIGIIQFYSSPKGFFGEIELMNFPPEFPPSYKTTTSFISEPDYSTTLKEESLKKGQEYINTLKGISGTLQINTEDKEYKPNYTIKGIVVDRENETIIPGVTVLDKTNNFSTTSDSSGNFILKGQYTIDTNNTSSIINPDLPPPSSPFKLTISSKEYNTEYIPVVNLDGSIKSEILGKLIPISSDVSEEIRDIENYDSEQLKLLKQQSAKNFISLQVERLFQLIKAQIIPAIIILLSKFGISKLKELLEQKSISSEDLLAQQMSCPADIDELNDIIDAKNKLVNKINKLNRGINKINKFIKPINKLISITEKAIPLAKIAMNIIAFIPSTTFTPIPSGAFTKLSDGLKLLNRLINVEGRILSNGIFQLQMLQAKMVQLQNLVGILDMAVGICAQEISNESSPESQIEGETITESNNFELLPQTQISQTLLKSTENMASQGTPVVPTVNGFTMDVITVDNVTIGGLKRRQAIAKDSFGVIVLRGEPSFSSNDQILVDELVFYIQQNNLKSGTANTTSILNPDLEEE